ncbi:MAG: 2-oxoglutarate dehydrogenase E1 component [Chitinophagales bacterium]
MDKYTFISNATPEFLENLYRDFKKDSTSVDAEFRKFFEGFDFATLNYNGKSAAGFSADEFKVFRLIEAYRSRGHYRANTNPIRPRKDRRPDLELADFGLSEGDLDKKFAIGAEIGLANASLQAILERLKAMYCGTIGFEFGYVRRKEEIDFFRSQIENNEKLFRFPVEKKEHILRKLNQAVVFEKFLGTKYMGEKRFSLEGGETTIPGFDAIIETAAKLNVDEVVIGMAHRGRLNVLANIMGKTYEEIFNEFEGNALFDLTMGDGDVKYHLGFSHQYPTASGKSVYLKLMPNPSHLEAVNPVVEGFVRAKADAIYNSDYDKILPILVHGDAAVAGQGIVYEVLQMMRLKGYETGGTIHFVINNQIGFTTSFDDARSSDYCSSIAATVEAPVLHVNGDDIEAVVFACEMAVAYRQQFNKDIFIDMVCYRRWGHNESDEPKFTQPGMYKLIDKHSNPRDIYTQQLEQEGSITAEMSKRLEKEFWSDLQARLDAVKQKPLPYKPQPTELAWQRLRMASGKDFEQSPDTAIDKKSVEKLITALTTYPEGFQPLRQVLKHLEDRKKLMVDNKVIDWAAAELMAYGSILLEGKNVRLSGEDVKRGTFTHRHAVITDQNTDQEYNRLSELGKDQGKFFIYNSHLSEYGVLGFEYGYAITHPDALVLWEAQFGDFSNGAQIIIDQFIAAGESKWQRKCGLVMLLPHGYEGQGPEHSSARLERFLQGCSELNMVVVNITDPANYFHALRRQLAWEFRKPLVVMSPKSLLRLPACQSPIENVMKGGFRELIDDDSISKSAAAKVRRVLLCTGKIYYDLLDKQQKDSVKDIAIVRLEQIYPIPETGLLALREKYSKAEIVWVQEEPQNMGAWNFLLGRLYDKLPMKVVARKNSASPATGFKKQHAKEQAELLSKAFA